jgi:hypothetical protein
MEEWSEGLDIISSVEPDASPEPLYPTHERIDVHADPADFTEEQVERLEELGFHADPDNYPPLFYVFC